MICRTTVFSYAYPRRFDRLWIGAALVAVLPAIASAQIIRDGTVGPDTPVQPIGPNYVIDQFLGELRGDNLFHSFSDFNIGTGESATFTGSAFIENVIGRVTGDHQSSIDGLLQSTIPDANLYLLNPNGILFGSNAQIDVDGSFNASTSDALEFSNGERFEVAGEAPILSASDPAGFGFLGPAAGPIVLTGSILDGADGVALSAADIELRDGAQIQSTAAGGDITLAASDSISLTGTRPSGVASALTTASQADAAGGSIEVTAPHVLLDDGAFLLTNAFGSGAGGDISITASERIRLAGADGFGLAAGLFTLVDADSNAAAGSIGVDAPKVEIDDGATVRARDGGNIAVTASEYVTLAGTNPAGDGVFMFASGATEHGVGSIAIEAPVVQIGDGAFVTTDSGGDIAITASEQITIAGNDQSGFGVIVDTHTESELDAGSITMRAPLVEIGDGAFINTGTVSTGAAGDIFIEAALSLTLSGHDGKGRATVLSAVVGNQATRAGGSINIQAGAVSLADGAKIATAIGGTVAGGDVTITATDSVTLSGTDPQGAGALLSAEAVGAGDAGAVSVSAPVIELNDGAGIDTGSTGTGSGGDITLTATAAVILGGADQTDAANPSLLTAFAGSEADRAGSIIVTAPVVELHDGAFFNTTTSGPAMAGAIVVTASDRVSLSGNTASGNNSFIASESIGENTTGDAGSITVQAPIVELHNGAVLSSLAEGAGTGGSVNVEASERLTLSGSNGNGFGSGLIATGLGAGDSGSVNIRAGAVELQDGAIVSTSARGSGAGGEINIIATDYVALSGVSSTSDPFASNLQSFTTTDQDAGSIRVEAPLIRLEDAAFIISNGFAGGAAGSIMLSANTLTLVNGASVQSANIGSGDAGAIEIAASDSIRLDNGTINTQAGAASGGNITLAAGELVALTDSEVTTNVTSGEGAGGNIEVNSELVALNESDITAQADAGRGGNINIVADQFVQSTGSLIDASATPDVGIDGLVTIESPTINERTSPETPVAEFLDVSALLQPRCAARQTETGSFIVAGTRNAPATPDGWLPAFDTIVSGGTAAPATEGMLALANGAKTFTSGEFDAASDHWSEASQYFAVRGDRDARADALRGLGQSQQAQGQYAAAVETLRQALNLAEASGDTARIAAALGSLGNAQIARGGAAAAEALLQRGLALARRTGERALSAGILNNLGNHHAMQGATDKSLDAYRQSARLAAELGDTAAAAKALSNSARAALQAGRTSRGAELLGHAEQHLHTLAASHEKAYMLVQLGLSRAQAATLTGDRRTHLLKAHSALQRAVTVSESLGDEQALSHALGGLGTLYWGEGRFAEGLYLTRRALRSAEAAQSSELLYRWFWQQGRLQWAQGRANEAIAAYRRAVEILEESRQDSQTRYGVSARFFRQRVAPVYLDLADALLQSADRLSDPAESKQLLLLARQTVEQLKTAEVRNYFHDECVAAVEAKQHDLDTVAAQAAVVYPILLADRTELLVTLPDGLKRYTVGVGAEEVTAAAREFRLLLEFRTPRRELVAAGRRLYDWLVRPFATALADSNVETLVLVPDGALRTIPLAALHDGNEFLIQSYSVAVTPSLTLIDPQPVERTNAKVLMAGLSESSQGFAPLEHVPEELQAIQQLYGGNLLLDGDFTIERFSAEMREAEPSIVHIASHGKFTGEAEGSFVLAHNGRLSLGRLSTAIGTTKFRDAPLDLLVLSACATAAGDDRAALGLAGIGIQAGARSAVGSLWNISDSAAAELTKTFYRELKSPAVSRAAALRRAQLRLLRSEQFAHPYFWSAFLLINNWL